MLLVSICFNQGLLEFILKVDLPTFLKIEDFLE